MISAREWWNVFENYNKIIFPAQLIIIAILICLVLWLFMKPSKTSNAVMLAFLGLLNIWNGVMFFIVIGTGLPSPLRIFQGGLFIVIGILLCIDVFMGKTQMNLPTKKVAKYITIFLLLLVASYPLLGLLRGHTYLQLVYPGTLPCATTSLSLILLATALPKTNKLAYVLLLIWAIPFAPLIQIPVFKVYEQSGSMSRVNSKAFK